MQLIKVLCNTDWKGRPNHDITIVLQSTDKEVLLKTRNEDIRDMFIDDLVCDLEIELEELELSAEELKSKQNTLTVELKSLSDEELKERWRKPNERWEMIYQDNEMQRIFAFGCEGEYDSVSYTIME